MDNNQSANSTEQSAISNQQSIINNHSSSINNQSSDLDYLVDVIRSSGIDIAPTYDEYTNLAFAIATDYGEAGRWHGKPICQLSQKYNETHANKMYSGAIASNHGIKHIASAFYLAKQAGVNIDEVRLKRAEERRKQREKCANVQMCSGAIFPHTGAHVHIIYMRILYTCHALHLLPPHQTLSICATMNRQYSKAHPYR